MDSSRVDGSAAVSLSAGVAVVVTSSGVELPAQPGLLAVPLDVGSLEVLEGLARPDGQVDWPLGDDRRPAEVANLLRDLDARGLLRGGEHQLPDGVPDWLGVGEDLASGIGASAREPRRQSGQSGRVVRVPLVMAVTRRGFEAWSHTGERLAVFSAPEVAAIAALAQGHSDEASVDGVDLAGLEDRLERAGLLVDPVVGRHVDRSAAMLRRALQGVGAATLRIAAEADRRAEQEGARRARGADPRTRVIGLQPPTGVPPLALGMLFAFAMDHRSGELCDSYDFVPDWHASERRLETYAREPAIYAFSNYVWSHERNLATSQKVKELSPSSLTVHGGPDAPSYEGDVERHFQRYPHVDVVVHGEGEVTFAELLAALRAVRGEDGSFDLSALGDVPGVTFRGPDGLVRTGPRDRISDLDTVPSPYLSGLFDGFIGTDLATAIIETNRGCPYGCTYCDWGSATLSRIRKFDLDRVFAELEWCARSGIPHVFLADANFGIFERDVAIAEKVAELKRDYGVPELFSTNYAKNTVKHLAKIVRCLVDAGVVTEGLLSLQSMDPQTLRTIKRSNIKTERYDELAREFRDAGLPLFVDVMLGLPGSTVEGFSHDLQQCIDREVTAKIFQTELLVNSPMNDPSYRAEHAIETVPTGSMFHGRQPDKSALSRRSLVVSTATFTAADYEEMLALRRVFRLLENYGVLRLVCRYVRHEVGMSEVDFMNALRAAIASQPHRWPVLALTLRSVPEVMAPPVTWHAAMRELRGFLLDEIGLPATSSLEALLRAQLAVLPAGGRQFPDAVELDHDVGAWFRSILSAKDAGRIDSWPDVVPRLQTFGPAQFVVTDPEEVCSKGLGFVNDDDAYGNWELDSPVRRAMPARHHHQ